MTNLEHAFPTLNPEAESRAAPRSMLIFSVFGLAAISLITSFSLLAAAVYIH